jgi:hypothetical protein
LSFKRRLYLDDKQVVNQRNILKEFSYSFILDKSYFNIIEVEPGEYDLRVNNKSIKNIKREGKIKILKIYK